jgi:two-component system chemotaxis response regulator CheB
VAKIRVLIVDDSSFVRKMVSEMLSTDPDIEIVDTGADGREALEKTVNLKPDVVILDVIMPMPDGLWALQEIMRQCPTPVILYSMLTEPESEVTIEAFKLGAIDVLPKPTSPAALMLTKKKLIEKVKIAAEVDRKKLGTLFQAQVREPYYIIPPVFATRRLVAIGASAGGPAALLSLMAKIPKDLSAGILIAQHMPAFFVKSFADHLSRVGPVPVKVAEEGDFITAKRGLLSPGDASIKVEKIKKGGVVALDSTESEHRVLPSIDLMMESSAQVYGPQTIGVLLSGMGKDGVKGLKAIKDVGGKTIVQDETSSIVYGMAKEAVNAGVVDKILPLDKIADEITQSLG